MSTRQTHDKLDIDQYLSTEADRFIINQDLIDTYKENPQNRIYDKSKRAYRSRFINYSHGSNPFCKVCDEDLAVSEEVFMFMIGHGIGMMYHIDCFIGTRGSKKRNIIYQDRAYRKNHLKGIPQKKELSEIEKFYGVLRKQYGSGVKIS